MRMKREKKKKNIKPTFNVTYTTKTKILLHAIKNIKISTCIITIYIIKTKITFQI